MDSINFLNIKQTSNNYYSLKNKNKTIKLRIKNILSPFGVDEQYGNSIIKFEIDQYNIEHVNIIQNIKDFEEKFKEQFNIKENELKSLINLRENNNIFIECKIKKIKNKIITALSFEDIKKNYLKTIYELGNNFKSDIILEIPTLWDFRKELGDNKNKIGLILNLYSIHVYEN